MAILIEDSEAEQGVIKLSEAQAARTSKTAMATAILRRAGQMSPAEALEWLASAASTDPKAAAQSG